VFIYETTKNRKKLLLYQNQNCNESIIYNLFFFVFSKQTANKTKTKTKIEL